MATKTPHPTPNEPNRPAAARSKPTAKAKPKPKTAPSSKAAKADAAAKPKSKAAAAKPTAVGSGSSKSRAAAAPKASKPKAAKSTPRPKTKATALATTQPEASAFENHVVKTLFDSLEAHVAANELGHVVGPKQFDLGPEESTGRLPDIAFVSFDRWAQYRRVPTHDRWHVAPDLLVQIVRKGELAEDFTTRLDACFEAGVRRVWMLFPDKGEARVYESAHDVHTLSKDQAIEGGDVLPGFVHSLGLLYREPKDLI